MASQRPRTLMRVNAAPRRSADRDLETSGRKRPNGITRMTLKDREKPSSGSKPTAPAVNLRGGTGFLARLNPQQLQATSLKLRQRQRIPLAPAQDDQLFAILSGILVARAEMAHSDARYLGLYFPGDVIVASAVPCFSDRALTAAVPADVLRFKGKTLARLLCDDADLLMAYERQRDRQLARTSVHASALATLEGPQRLAAFLIEMALELGITSGPTVAIELPISRMEIAQYLALNADTLSRLMSRFKADGLISQTSRHQITLRNWRAIADLCPITPALMALERNRPSPLS